MITSIRHGAFRRALSVLAMLFLFSGTVYAGTVSLSWNTNAEPDVPGYIVYYGTVSGTYTSSVDVSTATIWGSPVLTDGQRYYFAIKAYTRATGMQSAFSSEVTTIVTAAGTPGQLTIPARSSTLTGSSVQFQWSAGTGVSSYRLSVGAALGGTNIFDQTVGTSLTATVSGLPTDGSTVYVRLSSMINSVSAFQDSTYTAFTTVTGTPGHVTIPAPGSTLTGSSVPFQWSAGTGVSSYRLSVGTTLGGTNVFDQTVGTSLTATATGLPTDGSTVYVRLSSMINSVWVFQDSTYMAFASVAPPSTSLSAVRTVFSDGSGNRTTPAFAVSSGDLVVAFVSGDLLGALVPGPQTATVAGAGLTWTLVRRVTAQYGTSEIWSATAPAAQANATVTATMAFPTSQTSLTVVTFTGASGIGASAGASAGSGAPTVSVTTTKTGSLVYAVGNDWDGPSARTLAAGQALVHQYLGPADSHWVQTPTAGAIATSGTAVSLRDTGPTTDRWNFAGVEIQARWVQAAPTVSAGAAQSVASGAPVTLAGTASDSNIPALPLTYAWTQTAGPSVALSSANTLTTSFNAPTVVVGAAPVTLGFGLTVNNGVVATTATTTVVVQAPIGPPTASAGIGKTVSSAAIVALAGTASDPNVPARPLTFAWSQTSGPAVTLANASALVTSFTAPTLAAEDPPVTLGFTLTVSNGALTTTATTNVIVQSQLVPALLSAVRTVFSDGSGNRTTPAFAVSSGDLIVAFVSGDLLGALVPGPQTATVAGAGLTWTLVRRVTAQYGTSEIWSAMAPAALASATVTATMAFPTSQTSLTVVTFTGASGIGASAGASAGSGAPTVSVTTTKAGSLVYAVGNDWDGPHARTLATGQALVHQYLGPADSHWVQTPTAGAIATSGTAVSLRDTGPTTDRWNFAGVEIQARP